MEQNQIAVAQPTPITKSQLPEDPAQDMRAALTEVVKADLPEIVQAQVDAAKGIWVKEYVKENGKAKIDPVTGRRMTKVYLVKPDKDAGQYLLNQVIGKPKENAFISGKVNFIMDV